MPVPCKTPESSALESLVASLPCKVRLPGNMSACQLHTIRTTKGNERSCRKSAFDSPDASLYVCTVDEARVVQDSNKNITDGDHVFIIMVDNVQLI